MSRRLSTSSLTHDAITNKVVGNSNSLIYLPGFLLILIVNKIVGWFPIFEALNEQFVLYSVLSCQWLQTVPCEIELSTKVLSQGDIANLLIGRVVRGGGINYAIFSKLCNVRAHQRVDNRNSCRNIQPVIFQPIY